MTTIAYSAATRIMASDTQLTSGNRKFRTSKIRQLSCGGLIGSTGSVAHILKVQRWAEAGFDDDAKPDFGDESGDFECLIVKGDGTIYLLDGEMEMMPIKDEIVALGSGGTYALAALACGRTPEEAVRIAARYDAATSEPIETMSLTEPVKQTAKLTAKKRRKG